MGRNENGEPIQVRYQGGPLLHEQKRVWRTYLYRYASKGVLSFMGRNENGEPIQVRSQGGHLLHGQERERWTYTGTLPRGSSPSWAGTSSENLSITYDSNSALQKVAAKKWTHERTKGMNLNVIRCEQKTKRCGHTHTHACILAYYDINILVYEGWGVE